MENINIANGSDTANYSTLENSRRDAVQVASSDIGLPIHLEASANRLIAAVNSSTFDTVRGAVRTALKSVNDGKSIGAQTLTQLIGIDSADCYTVGKSTLARLYVLEGIKVKRQSASKAAEVVQVTPLAPIDVAGLGLGDYSGRLEIVMDGGAVLATSRLVAGGRREHFDADGTGINAMQYRAVTNAVQLDGRLERIKRQLATGVKKLGKSDLGFALEHGLIQALPSS